VTWEDESQTKVYATRKGKSIMKERPMREQRRNLENVRVTPLRVSRFEFEKHHEEMAEQQKERSMTPQSKADRVAQIMKDAHEKAGRRKKRR